MDATNTREIVSALAHLLRRVDEVLQELQPGQSLSPAGADKTNELVAARNEAVNVLFQGELKKPLPPDLDRKD